MKKKIVTSCLVVALLVVGIVGASLAYFTDKDEETNTFTVGKVKIDLVEDFDPDNAQLMPGKNINKDVWIENIGANDAYVWYEWYIPAALDSIDGSTGLNNIVHVNSLGSTWDKYRTNSKYWADGQTEAVPLDQTWDHDPEEELGITVGPQGYFGTVTIDGIDYHKYVALYHGKLAPGAKTTQAMTNVYMDKKVDQDETGYSINGVHIDYDFGQKVNIIVKAYAIQAEGFNDVYAAYNAYQAQN